MQCYMNCGWRDTRNRRSGDGLVLVLAAVVKLTEPKVMSFVNCVTLCEARMTNSSGANHSPKAAFNPTQQLVSPISFCSKLGSLLCDVKYIQSPKRMYSLGAP